MYVPDVGQAGQAPVLITMRRTRERTPLLSSWQLLRCDMAFLRAYKYITSAFCLAQSQLLLLCVRAVGLGSCSEPRRRD